MSQTSTSPPPLTADQIRRHLLRADEVARRAMSLGRHPFGALLVAPDGETVLSEQGNLNLNRVVPHRDAAAVPAGLV